MIISESAFTGLIVLALGLCAFNALVLLILLFREWKQNRLWQ